MTRAQDTASSARPARSAARLRRPLDLLQAIVAFGGREIASEKLCNALCSQTAAMAAVTALTLPQAAVRSVAIDAGAFAPSALKGTFARAGTMVASRPHRRDKGVTHVN
jgi:hypothetical protein